MSFRKGDKLTTPKTGKKHNTLFKLIFVEIISNNNQMPNHIIEII